MSLGQQDVSKDFAVGSRAAWQEFNARGGLRGRPVQLVSIEADGSSQEVFRALETARANPDCVALTGSTGDALSLQLAKALVKSSDSLALIAPWLHQSLPEAEEVVHPIFASRHQQISHALKTLSVMGVPEVGAVFANQQAQLVQIDDLQRVASDLRIRLVPIAASDDLALLGQRLPAHAPVVLLFAGGTPELVPFTQGLARQSRQRYVVALADVNLQTAIQMGAARSTALIATQVVPMTNSPLPIVRSYRETLSRLFDEPPTPLSLAGYLAARYTQEVLLDADPATTRQGVFSAAARRRALDLGGYRITFSQGGRGSSFVTQSMLTADGRLVG